MLLSRCVLVVCVIQPWFVTFTPQVMLLNGVKRPKLLDPSRSPMHHRDTSTGQVCPLGTPMYRLQHWPARKTPLQLITNETTLKALRRRVSLPHAAPTSGTAKPDTQTNCCDGCFDECCSVLFCASCETCRLLRHVLADKNVHYSACSDDGSGKPRLDPHQFQMPVSPAVSGEAYARFV